jgi:hypothetical protein
VLPSSPQETESGMPKDRPITSISTCASQPADLGDSSVENRGPLRGSGQTVFPGEIVKLIHETTTQGEITTVPLEDPLQPDQPDTNTPSHSHAPSPPSDGDHDWRGSRLHSTSPPRDFRSGRSRRRSLSRRRSRSPSARSGQACSISPKVHTTSDSFQPKKLPARRPPTTFPGHLRDSGKLSLQPRQDNPRAEPPVQLLHEGRKRLFQKYSFVEQQGQHPPDIQVTSTTARFSNLEISIGEFLIHLDAWKKDIYWKKVLPDCVIDKYGCTFYNKEQQSQDQLRDHLKDSRSAGANLATADLDAGKWKLFSPHKYETYLDEKYPILVAPLAGFSNEISFTTIQGVELLFPYWHRELHKWQFLQIKRETNDEADRSKRSRN